MKFGQKVEIIGIKYTDKTKQFGTIIGMRSHYNGVYIITEKQWLQDMKIGSYQVAYINKHNNKANMKWFPGEDLK